MIVAEVERTRTMSGWSADRTLAALGIARATYYRQRGELGREPREGPRPVSVHAVTAEERAAVIAFKRRHSGLRHRALPGRWSMRTWRICRHRLDTRFSSAQHPSNRLFLQQPSSGYHGPGYEPELPSAFDPLLASVPSRTCAAAKTATPHSHPPPEAGSASQHWRTT